VRHLDRVSVPQLVRREPPPHTGRGREPAELTPGSRRPCSAAGTHATGGTALREEGAVVNRTSELRLDQGRA
jgi:hypothetical protein